MVEEKESTVIVPHLVYDGRVLRNDFKLEEAFNSPNSKKKRSGEVETIHSSQEVKKEDMEKRNKILRNYKFGKDEKQHRQLPYKDQDKLDVITSFFKNSDPRIVISNQKRLSQLGEKQQKENCR